MPSKTKLLRLQEKEEEKKRLEEEKKNDIYWNEGVNKKKIEKEKKENEKQLEKLRKTKEKQDLEDLDNEEIKNQKVKKPKKLKNDDFTLLNKALATAPKSKQEKEKMFKQGELLKKKEEKEKIDKIKLEEKFAIEKQESRYRKSGIQKQDLLDIDVDNHLHKEHQEVTGIDNILDVLSNTNKKYTFNDFFNENIDQIKIDQPGLRLSQYNDKILNLWKKHPKNPKNIL